MFLFPPYSGISTGTEISDKSLAKQANKLDINDVNIAIPHGLSDSLKQLVSNHRQTNKVNSFYNIAGPLGYP